MTYTLIDDAGGRFAILNGALVVADGAVLDYETAQQHQVTLRVSDGHGGTFDKNFTIAVTDVDETPPPPVNHAPTDIGLSAASVAENASGNTSIGLLSGTDADSGDVLTYTLVDDAGGRFAILNGALVVADGAVLDYETAQQHLVNVRVSDGHGGTFDKSFTIAVTDVDETPPPPVNHAPTDIGLSAASAAENASGNTAIGTLSGTDADSGDVLTYTLIDDANGRFAILNGALVVADGAVLDYETAQQHQVTLRVSDGHGGTFDKNFTIAVTDVDETPPPPVNHAPTDIGLSAASVAENAQGDTSIGLLSGTDADSGDVLTYTLVDDAGGRFAIRNGALVVADGAVLDYETAQQHQVTLRVSDGHGGTFDKNFTIAVTDVDETPPPPVNHAPTAPVLSGGAITEVAATGAAIGTLSASDADEDAVSFTFADSLAGSNGLVSADGRFTIVGDEIRVRDHALIQVSADSAFSYAIVASDGTDTASSSVTVTVADVPVTSPPRRHLRRHLRPRPPSPGGSSSAAAVWTT